MKLTSGISEMLGSSGSSVGGQGIHTIGKACEILYMKVRNFSGVTISTLSVLYWDAVLKLGL